MPTPTDIRSEILSRPDGSFSVEVCADGEVWCVTAESLEQARAVAVSAVRGIVRVRRLRACAALPPFSRER